MNEESGKKRLVKFHVEEGQHDMIRLAGAMEKTSMAGFARLAVIERARQVTAGGMPAVLDTVGDGDTVSSQG